jgi:hypothetical protein
MASATRTPGKLAAFPDFLPEDRFFALRDEILGIAKTERSYLPLHKKGGAIAYGTLRKLAPKTVALYHCVEHQKAISAIVSARVLPTPVEDESSLSILVYDRPGDHIGWHYDHNFYRGRHFTVLLPIENWGRGADGLSAARLMARLHGRDAVVLTPPNTLVVFEGARMLHRATPIDDGERRVVLSMTYCTDPRNSRLQEAARRIKDTAFFGLRTLWA